ncbi:uncharacterized protein LOC121923761 [Sceloporus undulatus]|uniref:uncharacterized protein LOC121923761 n=1 Tax=Sceloporus undulatus TaxID=8520 RepID=UPI001C4DC2AA|nr:uncharacterized protein LOC121923761 [Sceloporus undulatus]
MSMAAAEDHIQDLCEEALCTICLEYLQNPVTIECGHNFCHDCLTQFWRQLEVEATCPQCRVAIQQRNVIPNWQLARFVDITQKLSHQTRKKKGDPKGDCEKHQEPLKLFCKEDETPICVVCDRSKEHRDHLVVPVEEAAEEYKDLINSSLEVLKKEKGKLLTYKSETEKESQDLLKQTEAEMEKTVAEFRLLRQFLEEQEQLLLSRMDEVKKEVSNKRDKYLARLSEELFSLEGLIQEMEEKKQQLASELLQDVKTALQRSEENVPFENPLAFPPELRWKFWDICDINPFLVAVMKQFKDALLPGLQLQKANVTLDPDTAHRILILSGDKKSVTCVDQYQDLPDNVERFTKQSCVLGCEKFTTGRHFWEISVGREEQWLAGVSRKSVKRKGNIVYAPEGGIWAVGMWSGGYRATNHPLHPDLFPNWNPEKIRVSLNCPGGQVAFYDADTGGHLYTFSGASFMGETLLPFFNVQGDGHLLISAARLGNLGRLRECDLKLRVILRECDLKMRECEAQREGNGESQARQRRGGPPGVPWRPMLCLDRCIHPWQRAGGPSEEQAVPPAHHNLWRVLHFLEGKRPEIKALSCLQDSKSMAAAEDHFQDLCTEALCTICLEYLQSPVTIECGHNFCHDCLTQFWRQLEDRATCPQCRVAIQQRNVIPNWQLARFVEITQKLSCQVKKRKRDPKGDCEKHQEPLKLFCKEDETPICVVCDRSKEHRDHLVVPVEEAAEEYKDLICSSVDVLKKKREKLLSYKSEAEKESQDLLKQTEAEMEKTVAEFRQLRQFLEDKEKFLLSRMEEVKKEVSNKRDEYLARLSGELSSLESLIQEMEEKKQQPASELLQDVKTILRRSEEKVPFENPLAFSVELRWKLWDICDINPLLVSVMKQFKDTLIPGLQLQKANVTLDPDTAHSKLILSGDMKSVTCGDQYQDLPDHLERFSKHVCVLGCEEFTAGRHFWEISVGREQHWLAGVSRKSVKRKGDIAYGPEGGIWAIGKWGGEYKASNHPYYPPVSSNREPEKIRVSLNCSGGQVAFYDADTGDHLYTFSGASFMGKTLLPFFSVQGKGHLLICP